MQSNIDQVLIAQDVFIEDLEDGGMLLMKVVDGKSEVSRFTSTATFLFKRLVSCTSVEDIIHELLIECSNVDSVRVNSDIDHLLNLLVNDRMVDIRFTRHKLDDLLASLIIIGPVGVGKTTVAKLIGERIGKVAVSLDDICYDYYGEIGWNRTEALRMV